MNRLLVILSILIVAAIAYSDARARLAELKKIAANTPAQVEMKSTFNNNVQEKKLGDTYDPQTQQQTQSAQTSNQQTNQAAKQIGQTVKNFQQNRNNDIFK